MLSQRLSLLVAFPAFYIGVAALRAGQTRPLAWLLVAVAIAVAVVLGRIPESMDRAFARLRLSTAAGVSIAIAAAALPTRPAWAALARDVGTFVAMAAALRSIDRIDGDVGLAPKATGAAVSGPSPRAINQAALGVMALAWGTAAIFDGRLLLGSTDAKAAAFVAAGAGITALFGLALASLLIGGARHLELSVRPRALACAGAAAAGTATAAALAISNAIATDAAIAVGGALASALILRIARTQDALALARYGRRALTLVVFGGPVCALAAVAVDGRMPAVVVLVAGITLLVGAISPKLEEPFLPVKGILLRALRDAREAAREREARAAIAHALVCIREACAVGLGPRAAPSPELWLLHPTRVLTIDAAGYLKERSADLPEGIFDVAIGEPHATLRTAVLRALEVRRADLRPLLAWLDHRDALLATVIADSVDPDGLLVIPAGARTEDLTLEEVRATKLLADAFVAVAQASSAMQRHLGREQALQQRIDTLDDEIARLRYLLDLEVGRHALATSRLARPATVGIYSAASRFAYEALERRITQDAPTMIVARAGIDPVPYIARAHLSGPRKSGPFVVVDGTASREHDIDRWNDERTSPLALADRGLLFLVDGAALPREIQVLVARTVAERRPPWERASALDFTLAMSTTQPPDELLLASRLAPELKARFDGSELIVLPGLRDRPEDLRSIVADRLAREGLRVHGRPVGIEAAAFARLVEYSFEGEDAELASIVTRLVARVEGDVVRAADVDELGLLAPKGTFPSEPALEGRTELTR